MRIPRRIHLASGAIPVNTTRTPDFFDIPAGATCITFYVTYLGGDVDSQLDMDLEWTNGSEVSRDMVVQSGIVVTQPEGRYNVFETIRRGPQPGAAVTIEYEVAFTVPGGATGVRLVVTSVNAGGTVQITLTGGSDGCPDGGTVVVNDVVPTPSGGIPASVNFIIPRTLHLDDGAGAAVTLPAAGAFTNQTAFEIPPGLKKIAFDYVYTRGAAGGRATVRILWGNSVEETRALVIDQNSLAIAGTNGEFNMYEEQIILPAPVDDNPISDKLEYEVPAGELTVRLVAAERGATATPGDLLITLTGRG